MNKKILSKEQLSLLSLLSEFKKNYYLAGGTAIALQLGHRQSIDFDLFTSQSVNHKKIIDTFNAKKLKVEVIRSVDIQLNLVCRHVNFTFLQYPYAIHPNLTFEKYIQLPDITQLAAMKAFVLGRRAKWKDYVDLFFLLKEKLTVGEIILKAKEIFDNLFSEKQFRAQLMYFKDIDYSEEVVFIRDFPTQKEIMKFLTRIALDV